jgi:hypothetical protein
MPPSVQPFEITKNPESNNSIPVSETPANMINSEIMPAPPPPAQIPPSTRRPRRVADKVAQRQSARLAAKNKGKFIDSTSQATRRKALVNSLSGCSVSLKKQVMKRNILTRNKLPVGVSDLRKLVTAAGVNCKSVDVVGTVRDVAE